MLFDNTQAHDVIFKSLRKEIARATVDKKHPFRYVVLATSGFHGPSVRYVVLRKLEGELDLVVYTDSRSEKVVELQKEEQAEILLYHPKKQCQLRITGKVELHRGDEIAKKHWQSVEGRAENAYNSLKKPGIAITNPKEGFRLREHPDSEFFTVLKLVGVQLDALQLNHTEHLRTLFTLQEDGTWLGQWLVP